MKNIIDKRKNKKNEIIKKSIYLFIFLKLININTYAIDASSFADGSKDLTGILLSIFISIGIILILLCIAIIVKINTLKKAADTINRYIEMYGMPKGMNNE